MRPLDVDALFRLHRDLRGTLPRGLRWLDDDHLIVWEPDADDPDRSNTGEPRRGRYVRIAAESGERELLFDPEQVSDGLEGFDELDEKQAARLAWSPGFRPADEGRGMVIRHAERVYRLDLETGGITRPAGEEKVQNLVLSPDQSKLAIVRGHDLFVAATDGSGTVRLTDDGDDQTLNGRLDWVYQEELYGRGNWDGFRWSPDSSKLAYLQLDESPVTAYRVEDHLPTDGKQELWSYPKAGAPNPKVRVGVVAAGGGETVWMDLSAYPEDDRLVVEFTWTPDGEALLLQVTDRIQSRLDLVRADPATGETRVLFTQDARCWQHRSPVRFVGDDRFLWLAAEDGWQHLYVKDTDGNEVRRLTEGEWEVVSLVHVDRDARVVYVLTDEGGILERHLWRIPLDGGRRERLTTERGTHGVQISPEGTWAVDTWSRSDDPGGVELIELESGSWVRSLGRADVDLLRVTGFVAPSFTTIRERDGFEMEAFLVRPPAFGDIDGPDGVLPLDPEDPAGPLPTPADAPWPTLIHVYGGPHNPLVRESWAGLRTLLQSELAKRGVLVACVDPQSASGKGQISTEVMFRNPGRTELADLLDAADHLVDEGLTDPDRLGINGWSYGGFMAAYALTHTDRFAFGVSGAPVTDWANYDSIYTERYVGTPQDNADGYRDANVVAAAADLQGELLLIHGTLDENVHLANSLQFAHALQQAGHPFRLMLYPKNRHGITDVAQSKHLQRLIFDYVVEHALGPRG